MWAWIRAIASATLDVSAENELLVRLSGRHIANPRRTA